MKKLTIIMVISLFSILALGQESKDDATAKESSYSFGIKFNAGASEIIESFTSNPFNFAPDNKLQFAYNFGILTTYKFDDRNEIALEILYNQINGLDHLGEDYINSSGEKFGSGFRDIERHITYLSIPVYYTYRISSWKLGLGIQTSFAMASSDVETSNGTRNGMPYYYQVSKNGLDIIMYDIGPKLYVIYGISRRFFVDLDYYHGVVPINNNMTGYSSQSLQNEELSLGVGFKIH